MRWGVIAKTFIFVPLAISFVGAAVIWRNIFAGGGIEPLMTINGATPSYQIGLLKALLGHGAEYNEPLYNLKFWGNFFLMWISYGCRRDLPWSSFQPPFAACRRTRSRPPRSTGRTRSRCFSA